MTRNSYADLIELELSSCIQKLAYIRGLTPRSFPGDELGVIQDFGVACCRRLAADMQSPDEDTNPGWRSRIPPPTSGGGSNDG